MLYVVAALVLLGYATLLYRAYREGRDVFFLLKGLGLMGAGSFFVSFVRTMIVYKPLMVLHIAATILFWYALLVYLIRGRVHGLFFAAPLVSMTLFFVVAWFFREV
ncbi:hypothetical protein [Hydrogenimonas sp.]